MKSFRKETTAVLYWYDLDMIVVININVTRARAEVMSNWELNIDTRGWAGPQNYHGQCTRTTRPDIGQCYQHNRWVPGPGPGHISEHSTNLIILCFFTNLAEIEGSSLREILSSWLHSVRSRACQSTREC